MRSTTVIGAALIVVIIAALLAFSLRGRNDRAERDTGLDSSVTPAPLASGGQFFQEIPAEVSPEASLAPSISPLAKTGVVKITVSEEGFSPANVTVSAGTSITFVNNGQAAHWPASDIHPTHDILPGFDAKRGLATGETYTYTFTEVGVWHCHDHLMPQQTCVITVQ